MKHEIKIPNLGESVSEGTLASWLKNDGDMVELDDEIFELESDKATLNVPSTAVGILRIKIEEGATVQVGEVVAYVEETSDTGSSDVVENREKQESEGKASHNSANRSGAVATEKGDVASPAAQKILSEHSLSSGDVKGTGKDGRLTKGDVLEHLETAKSEGSRSEAKPEPAKETKDGTSLEKTTRVPGSREMRHVPLSRLRKTIATNLVTVKNQTAMLTTFNEVDMSQVMDVRNRYKDEFVKKYGVKPGITSFFAMAVAAALQEFSALNAVISDDGEEIVYHDYVDLGISVSTEKGLVVPVIRNAEVLGLSDMEKEIQRLATAARDRKLSIPDLQGGTFSITNGGVFGSLFSTPILNVSQSGILGLHNIVERPVAVAGKVEIRPMMYVALSYDHRTVDGRESVSFLKRVSEMISDPVRLLMKI